MKTFTVTAAVALSSVAFNASAQTPPASGWVNLDVVNILYTSSPANGYASIYAVGGWGFTGTNCPTGPVYIGSSSPMFNQWLAMLLTAKSANSQVQITLADCGVTNTVIQVSVK